MAYLFVFLSVILGSTGQVLMKLGTIKIQLNLLSIVSNFYLLGGLFLYGVSAIFWIFAISKLDLSYAYPMVAFGYVIVSLLAFFILGESISPLRVIGLCTIVLGVLIISKS